ncbi:MAG: phosphoribosylformylglycinamidine synthase subunit PurQ [Roseovarius sp.]|nr:phosphoribosylformylglycinamidine synthase subunit PurQ [Roseovarius sp.]
MRAAVIVFPGSNCDRDLKVAFQNAGANVEMIWHKETQIPKGVDVIGIPGGFSFGDYLRCGAIAANSPICRSMLTFAESGGYVLGICNGFQILTETGLLPGTLLRNENIKYICKPIEIKIENCNSVFTSGYGAGSVVTMPIAHQDGNYYADDNTVSRLAGEDRVAFRYVDNPNGSRDGIAGVLSENRRVLGMMPHPERMAEPMHGNTGGRRLFQNLAGLMEQA